MTLINQLKTDPTQITFSQVIEHIENHYLFIPTAFKNGETYNSVNQNNGSCKIFFLAKLHQLSEQQTLQLFGDYYRKDVLQNPDAADHQNIRNFMKFGWQGIQFEGTALEPK
jgi:HopJ type III effector protein